QSASCSTSSKSSRRRLPTRRSRSHARCVGRAAARTQSKLIWRPRCVQGGPKVRTRFPPPATLGLGQSQCRRRLFAKGGRETTLSRLPNLTSSAFPFGHKGRLLFAR